MTSYYWVNLGDSHREVAEYRFLWAPSHTLDKNGRRVVSAGWKAVPKVRQGDIIFCYFDGKIKYLATSTCNAYEAKRPENRAFHKWKKEGYKIDVELEVLIEPLDTQSISERFIARFNQNCTPKLFTSQGRVGENYMIAIPQEAAAFLLQECEIEKVIPVDLGNAEKTKDTSEKRERDAIAKARIGQGRFRQDLLEYWCGTCPLTQVDVASLLIASHIVPWRLSNNSEKVDKFNGFVFSPSVDRLFDKGFISFDDDGGVLQRNDVPTLLLQKLGIPSEARISGLQHEHINYLKRHRTIYGFE